ncbi:transmembrane protease serine 9-like [Anopheles aquasalis]|uniref:transmembrane protease serine 9-like n=1 Tax=Anopheles aquasalis TaxID=42839 RepID=UPI00215ADFD1|nr:transmembrane protease serine 9-like [Anopheles aquasalis]
MSWNDNLTDFVCGKLGYFGGTNFTFISDSKRLEGYCMYRVKEKSRLAFELIDSTQCNQRILKLQCQEYHCGRKVNKSTIDERYEDRRISGHTSCASLALAFNNNPAIKCAVNIVSPRWALTSYTCIKGKAEFADEIKWKLFAGLIKFTTSEEQLTTPHIEEAPQIVNIKRVVPYPRNNQPMYSDDAVLLELATPLQFNDVIGSVCLTETPSTIDPTQRCLTTGWQTDFEDTAITEQYLMNVSAGNTHSGRCNSYNRELPDNTICVEPLTKATCYNDTGAPLMCYVAGTGQWQLQGVLSNHGNCDKRRAIYNSINPAIATWIRNTVGNGRMFEQVN